MSSSSEDGASPEALVRLATLATYDGSIAQARDLAAEALGRPGVPPPTLILIHRRLALAHLLMAELERAEAHARTAGVLALADGDRPTLARVMANLACVRALRGDTDGARAGIAEALTIDAAPGTASIDDSPAAVAGVISMYLGDHDEARLRLESALAHADGGGGDALSTGVLFALSELASRTGRFGDARALARRGLVASEQTGQSTERTVLLFAQGLADAHLGALDAAREAAAEGLAIAEAAHHRFAMAQNLWVLGFAELSLGHADAAWEALGRVVAFLRAHGVGLPGVVPVARTAARCRGLLLAAEGDPRGALRELDDAIARHRAARQPFELGRTLLSAGAIRRRAKERGAARRLLEEATALFEELGAVSWAAHARADLGRIGGRRAATRDELTGTEMQVAQLAADGRTNREIAAELFIAERTVEANLTRVYRKLSVRTRTQLARRLPAL